MKTISRKKCRTTENLEMGEPYNSLVLIKHAMCVLYFFQKRLILITNKLVTKSVADIISMKPSLLHVQIGSKENF